MGDIIEYVPDAEIWDLYDENRGLTGKDHVRGEQLPIDGRIYNDIMDVWLFEYDGEVDLNNAITDEVVQVAWMNRDQIKELFEHNMFVEKLEYFFMEVDKERS